MTKTKSYVLLVFLSAALLCLCLAPNYASVRAQDPTPSSMQGMDMTVAADNQIDGSQHPEKISDEDAYRMFLLAARLQDGSAGELSRQQAMFGMLNLSSDQSAAITQIIADFGLAFDAANQARDAVETSAPGTTDQKAYRKQIKDIVHEAQMELEFTLGGQLSGQLHAVINYEKSNMKIAVED